MKEQIKELRLQCDGLAQLTKELKPRVTYQTNYSINDYIGSTQVIYADNSKEIEKAVDSLYLAKAWLGKILGELGNENPYGSGYKTKEDIVPTQDVAPEQLVVTIGTASTSFNTLNHIEKVDWLRTRIEKLINEVKEIPTVDKSREFAIARTNSYTHLCEARFFLGFEMERIKREE